MTIDFTSKRNERARSKLSEPESLRSICTKYSTRLLTIYCDDLDNYQVFAICLNPHERRALIFQAGCDAVGVDSFHLDQWFNCADHATFFDEAIEMVIKSQSNRTNKEWVQI